LQKSSFSPATALEKFFDGARLTWELLLLQSLATAPEKLIDGV
jgi:hypothetical protein